MTSVKRGRYRQSYDQNTMADAVNAVIENSLPVERVAKQYDIPITTLKDRIKGRIDIDCIKSGPNPMFTEDEESILVKHLHTMSEIGYGYSRIETLNLASDYAVHLGYRGKEKPLSLKWLYNFLGRWPELKIRKPRALEVSRAMSATRNVITNYFNELERVLKENSLMDKPERIFNIDEKGISTNHKPPNVVAGAVSKPQAVTGGKSQTVTIIGCVNGMGNQIPSYFVFPGKRLVEGLLAGATPGTDGTVSDSGWSNTEIFEQCMRGHLLKYLPERSVDAPVLVLYDGHKSHVSLSLIQWAKENHIVLFVLPPHTSHLLQPLDVGCFGPFEMAWNSVCHTHLRESGGKVITRYDVCILACRVYTSTLTPSNIQASFRKCGIYPLNKDSISNDLVAPSLSFDRPSSSTSTDVSAHNVAQAESFLEAKGGKVLENVKIAKSRKTLSKIVGGKEITNQETIEKNEGTHK